MNIRFLARTVVYNQSTRKILLVKNKGATFWYAPGGGWEYERENILECARREVLEETGIAVDIKRLLYAQEFHESPQMIFFETFWLSHPVGGQSVDDSHVDLDPRGAVEIARWFGKEELQDLKVFPERLKGSFWDTISSLTKEDPFIGVY